MVTTWKQFSRMVRKAGKPMLLRLSDFSGPILISGCQRSGTTLLSWMLLETEGFSDYRRDKELDSELEGALILSGIRQHEVSAKQRYCFQTTYLNERYYEYFEHLGNFKLIFFIRNPYSVVYSMCYHWKRRRELRNFALNELFEGCGLHGMNEKERSMYEKFGTWGISRIRKACLAYNGKLNQVVPLKERIKADMIVVDYDDLVQDKQKMLTVIYDFIGVSLNPKYGEKIHSGSLSKAHCLSEKEHRIISRTCTEAYEAVKAMSVCDVGFDMHTLDLTTKSNEAL